MPTTVHASVHMPDPQTPRDFLPPKKGWRLRHRPRRQRRRACCHCTLLLPTVDSANTQRARKGCHVRLCGGLRRERANAGGKANRWRGHWLTCNREAQRQTARRRFSTLISTEAWADKLVDLLERLAPPSAAANTNSHFDLVRFAHQKLRFDIPACDGPRRCSARRHLRGLSTPASRGSRPPPFLSLPRRTTRYWATADKSAGKDRSGGRLGNHPYLRHRKQCHSDGTALRFHPDRARRRSRRLLQPRGLAAEKAADGVHERLQSSLWRRSSA